MSKQKETSSSQQQLTIVQAQYPKLTEKEKNTYESEKEWNIEGNNFIPSASKSSFVVEVDLFSMDQKIHKRVKLLILTLNHGLYLKNKVAKELNLTQVPNKLRISRYGKLPILSPSLLLRSTQSQPKVCVQVDDISELADPTWQKSTADGAIGLQNFIDDLEFEKSAMGSFLLF
jgi:hypothetical protein